MTTDSEQFIVLSKNFLKYFKSSRQIEDKIQFLMEAFELYVEVVHIGLAPTEQPLLKTEILSMTKTVLYDTKTSFIDEKYYEDLISLLLKEDSKDTFAMVLAQAIDFVMDTRNSWRVNV